MLTGWSRVANCDCFELSEQIMNSSYAMRLCLRHFGVLVALSAIYLSPRQASAGCGDEMVIFRKGDLHPVAPLIEFGKSIRHSIPSLPCPCHGPSCSSAPAPHAPLSDSTTRTSQHSDSALLTSFSASDRPPCSISGHRQVSGELASTICDVFHPPR